MARDAALPHSPDVDRSFASETNFVLYVDEVAEVPLTFSAIIGDVLYDLRSALDHLAWQLVIANGGTPNRDTAFPIYSSPAGREFRVKTAGMDPAACAFIEGRQHTTSRVNQRLIRPGGSTNCATTTSTGFCSW